MRALIAALLIPALCAGTAFGVLNAMAAYTGAGLDDVMAACAPDHLTPFLSQDCEPVQTHYWLILLSGAVAAAGLGLLLLGLIAGRTDWSVFSFRGLLAALVMSGQWLILIGGGHLAKQQWLPDMPAATFLLIAAPAAAMLLWLVMSALGLRKQD